MNEACFAGRSKTLVREGEGLGLYAELAANPRLQHKTRFRPNKS
jgi:hypothetical protein